jgi:microsomal dipeptidase-like Zn-dependent dipeptidase
MFLAPIALLLIALLTKAHAEVDLHVHLTMKEGMSWLIQGDARGSLRAQTWEERFRTRANFESMDRSGLKVVVAALFAHPWASSDLRQALRRQHESIVAYTRAHPHWRIVRSPTELRETLALGQRAIVLSLEGASHVLETEADLREWYDDRGLRIVTYLHLTGDRLGGVSIVKQGINTPLGALLSFWPFGRRDEDIRTNPIGLSPRGIQWAARLIEKGFWLDLAHASDQSLRDLEPTLARYHQPWLITHTSHRTYHGSERGVPQWQVEKVHQTGGVLGILPSPQMLASKNLPSASSSLCSKDPAHEGGFESYIAHQGLFARTLAWEAIQIGTDFNAPIPALRPFCSDEKAFVDQGFWNYAQTGAFLKAINTRVPEQDPSRWPEAFARAWERAVTRN